MRNEERGSTILEVMIATVFLAITMTALGLGVLSGVKGTNQMKEGNVVQNQAFSFMERIQHLPFGNQEDLAAAPSALDTLFDDSLGLPSLTLCQLRRAEHEDGLTFRIAGFENDGVWEVKVNRDFDGDGILDAEEEVTDLLRIQILFQNRPVLTSYRARPAVAQ